MSLTLTTLRCPDTATPESRHAAGGELSIGRGPDNDWVLPDPDRHLSKRHCVLSFRSGQWQLNDVSSNGTFLNRDAKPVGAASPRPVRSGDRLRLGNYEIELTIDEADARAGTASRSDDSGFGPATFDPFAETPAPATSGWGDAEPSFGAGTGSPSSLLPLDFDPLGGTGGDAFGQPTQSDHAPALHDAFRPPAPSAAAIPDDWDLDSPKQPAAIVPPAPPVAPRPAAEPATADTALLTAFLRATGLADAEPADPLHTMEAAGAALRAAVAGIRQTLIARATIKGEFRIEQTMVRASGNNPLKFSAGDDDAMAALLGLGRRNAMAADRAVTEALGDIRLHELATMAAMQSAVRALLAQFDPEAIEKSSEGGGILPGQRKARLWDAFAAMHSKVSQALSDDFDSVFGKAFARAYERAMRESGAGNDRT